MDRPFEPRLQRLDLVPPRRIGAHGGPTRGSAYGPSWHRTGHGLFVPASRPSTPEQRVVESVMPMPVDAALTGWAALRLAGAAFFDGRSRPVSAVVGAHRTPRPRQGVRWIHRDVDATVRTVAGLRLLEPAAALLDHLTDEIRRGRPREAVVGIDMAIAAGVCSLAALHDVAAARPRLARRAHVEQVIRQARAGSASPPESRLRLLWTLDCGLPAPQVNHWLLDEAGRRVAVPDLLDPESGLVVEYDGREHAADRRRARDAEKDDIYRELGLEPVRVTGPDMTRPLAVADRLQRAYARAVSSSRPRRWAVGEPFTRTQISPTCPTT